MPFDVHLMVFGDSTATGYGCLDADEVPGVLIARGLAEESGKRIRLSTKAIVGATSKGLSGQIDAMFVAGPPPDAAVVMIGANDITAVERHRAVGAPTRRGGAAAAGQRRRRRRRHLPRLRRHHRDPAAAALGGAHARTAPGPVAQASAVRAAGGVPVPFSDLLAPEFRKAPEVLFSPDMFHPSAAGYALAAKQLLPALCNALGEFTMGPSPRMQLEPRTAEAARCWPGSARSAGCGVARRGYPRRSSCPRG